MGEWMLGMGRRSWQSADFGELFDEPPTYFNALPLSSLPSRSGTESPWWDEMMQHPNSTTSGRLLLSGRLAEDDRPGAQHHRLVGHELPRRADQFRRHAGTRQDGGIRDAQQLIIGPWPHRVNGTRALNGIDFGEQAIINLDDYNMRFYDRWLKGSKRIERDPRVHVFVLGANEWWTSDDWPLPEAEPTPFYFHSRGHANSLKGDGVLSTEPPGHEPADAYATTPPTRSAALEAARRPGRRPHAQHPRRHALLHERRC